MIIKITITIVSFFIMANFVFADTDSKLEESNREKTKQNTAPSTSLKKTNKQTKKKWPPIFYPSEKINADSSVSFPVDI